MEITLPAKNRRDLTPYEITVVTSSEKNAGTSAPGTNAFGCFKSNLTILVTLEVHGSRTSQAVEETIQFWDGQKHAFDKGRRTVIQRDLAIETPEELTVHLNDEKASWLLDRVISRHAKPSTDSLPG